MNNDHPSPSKGYKLPFGLKVKPSRHYFKNGVIHFAVSQGSLHYGIVRITKEQNCRLINGIVKSKEHLDKLLAVKTLDELQTIDGVVN